MGQDGKWGAATTALDTMSNNQADSLRLGMAIFAGDGDNCAAPDLELSVGDRTAEEFQGSYSGKSPSGATPLRTAFNTIKDSDWLTDNSDPDDADRSKNVLVVTDGLPNCTVADPYDYDQYDEVATVAAAEALAADGVNIHVIGFGDAVSDAQVLNDIAEAGGTNNESDPDRRFYQASNSSDLDNAFTTIGAQLGSCTLELDGEPADPSRIYVVVADNAIVRDDSDGFVYNASDNTIVLQGALCEQVKANSPSVEVIFGCPPSGGGAIID